LLLLSSLGITVMTNPWTCALALVATLSCVVPTRCVVLVPLTRVVGNTHVPKLLGIHQDHRVPVADFQNIQYFANVSVGTPPQSVRMLLDTGSSNMWLPGSKFNSTHLRANAFYNSSASSTYVPNGTAIQINYGSGAVRGFQSADDVSLGGSVARQFVFTEATQTRGYSLGIEFDGILGLGWPSLSIQGVPTLMTRLGINNFGLALSSKGGSLPFDQHSVLILGGLDTQFFHAPLTYYPVLRDDWWVVKLCGIRMNGKLVNLACADGNCSVIFDSGTSWINGPKSLLNSVHQVTVPSLDCSNMSLLPRLSFDLCGAEFELTADEYTNMPYLPILNKTLCQTGIRVHNDTAGDARMQNTVILGDSFLRKVFIHHDFKGRRVGLARSKTNTEHEYVV